MVKRYAQNAHVYFQHMGLYTLDYSFKLVLADVGFGYLDPQ